MYAQESSTAKAGLQNKSACIALITLSFIKDIKC